MRAILFHHVGGDHYAFQSVRQWLSPEIESITYELPGRADRIREPLINQASGAIGDAFRQLQPWLNEPYCFIGLSLGGLIAYRLTQSLREQGMPMPAGLFLASRKCPETYTNPTPASTLPEAAFWQYVLQYGGCPPELPQHRELREFYEPILRADFALAEDLMRQFTREPKLDIPVAIFYGRNDHPDFSADNAGDWASCFVQAPDFRQFPGGHFFLYEQADCIHYIKQRLGYGG